MLIMRRVLTVIAVLMLVPLVQAELMFDCEQEYCNYNGTTDKWNCYYEFCPEKPDWIKNVTNLTTQIINVTDCQYEDFAEIFNKYSKRIDGQINDTLKLELTYQELYECETRTSKLSAGLDVCLGTSVNRTLYEQVRIELSNLKQTKIKDDKNAQMLTIFMTIVGAAIGVAVMRTRQKTKPDEDEPDLGEGEESFNVNGVNFDKKMRKMLPELFKDYLSRIPKEPKSPDASDKETDKTEDDGGV